MGTVITFDSATWLAMKAVKNSLMWYEEQPRDNDVYGTAKAKERRLLKYMIRQLPAREVA